MLRFACFSLCVITHSSNREVSNHSPDNNYLLSGGSVTDRQAIFDAFCSVRENRNIIHEASKLQRGRYLQSLKKSVAEPNLAPC